MMCRLRIANVWRHLTDSRFMSLLFARRGSHGLTRRGSIDRACVIQYGSERSQTTRRFADGLVTGLYPLVKWSGADLPPGAVSYYSKATLRCSGERLL